MSISEAEMFLSLAAFSPTVRVVGVVLSLTGGESNPLCCVIQ